MAKIKTGRFVSKRLVLIIIGLAIIAFGAIAWLTAKVPWEVSLAEGGWPTANRDLANTRSVTESKISSETVSELGVAWELPLSGSSQWGAAATNPLVLFDKVLIQDLMSNVYLVKLSNGELVWKKEYNLPAFGPNGPAVGWGKVFVLKGHFEVAALDLLTGREVWSVRLSEIEHIGLDIQVSAYDNMVFVSTVPGSANENFYTGGGAGVIYALSASDGKKVWEFNTVDSEDLWGNPEVNSGGGAWYPPAIDAKTGILYWGIGNPGPWPGTAEFPNGTSRPGDNLYTNSLVALEAKTGRLVWHNQVTPHDLFDYDFQIPPILAEIDGREVVIGAGKSGEVVAFDRMDGEELWRTEVGVHQNDKLKTLPNRVTRVSPGPLGGVETPMAYADGVVYAPIVDLPADYRPGGLVVTTFDPSKGKGQLAAISAKDGKVLWNRQYDSMVLGGATVVNDLVFTSTFDGTVLAVSRESGETVWSYKAAGGINGWPAVSGGTILVPVGLAEKPVLVALRLGAKPKDEGMTTSSETDENLVRIRNFSFSPGNLTVNSGTKVVWVNEDSVVHTVEGEGFDSGDMEKGARFEHTFTTKGKFDYICGPHPFMRASITVL